MRKRYGTKIALDGFDLMTGRGVSDLLHAGLDLAGIALAIGWRSASRSLATTARRA